VDLCRAVALDISAHLGIAGLKTRWVALTAQDRVEAVRSRRVDLECGTTSWTLSRQATVDFSLITFVDGANILSPAGASPARLADFAGKRIAVKSGTTTEKVLRETLARGPRRARHHRVAPKAACSSRARWKDSLRTGP
jgi:ABC-type amino acid transport substrate-binding protein